MSNTPSHLLAGVAAAMTISSTAIAEPLLRQDFEIVSDPGVRIAVREVRNGAGKSGVPVVLVHGARVSGIPSFDLPVPHGSLAAELASAGYPVYIVDLRGYGASSRPGQDQPPAGEPLARSEEVVRDLRAVVQAVRSRARVEQVAIAGWATGGHWAGMYASREPAKVSHLVIYNSLYGAHAGHPTLGPGSDLADRKHPDRFDAARFGAYRFNTAASLLSSWDASIPTEDKTAWRDPAMVEAYQREALASDPSSGTRNPPSFRAPSGAMADSFELASGRKLWSAETITARVLLLRSERDFWSRPEDMSALARDLPNAASVRAVTLPGATHYVHLDRAERGRTQLLDELRRFLAPPGQAMRQGGPAVS